MGRNLKNVIALMIILGLICWQQSSSVRPAYAEDGRTGRRTAIEQMYPF